MNERSFRFERRCHQPKTSRAACLAALGFGIAGCQDHRITLAQFLEMQPAAKVASSLTATTAADTTAANPNTAINVDRALAPYRVGPGDVLGVSVVGAEGIALYPQIQVRIDRGGEVDLPLIGPTKVADQELQDVERTIHKRLVPSVAKEAAVHVGLVSAETTNVLVVGAVTAPGLVPLRRSERNVLHAIVGAGGVTESSSGNAVLRRIRHPEVRTPIFLRDPVELANALSLEPLEQGDILYVEAAEPNLIFVGGLVLRPSQQEFMAGTERNILQALAAAGGLRTDVTPRQGTLIRRMPDGKDVAVKLSLNRLATGKDPNIALAGGDILWVPETIGTRVQDWVNRNIFFRAGASVNYTVTGVEYLNRQSQQSRSMGGSLEDTFDPFGFINRGALLQSINQQGMARP